MSGPGGDLMCTPDGSESGFVSPIFDLFGARIVLYLSVVLISYELMRVKTDPNARLRKLMHDLLDCGMDEELVAVLELMDRLGESCKTPAQLSTALNQVEELLQKQFPAFLVRLDPRAILPISMEQALEDHEPKPASSEDTTDSKGKGKGKKEGKTEKHKTKSSGSGGQLATTFKKNGRHSCAQDFVNSNGEETIPNSFYWSSLYSVIYMIVHQCPSSMLDRFNCPKAFSEPSHYEQFEVGSFDNMYFCRCQANYAAAVHETLILCYENTIGSYFFIKKIMTGVFAALQLDFGVMLKCFYEAWKFQGEINSFLVPVCLFLAALLIDIQMSSYTSIFDGLGKLLPTETTFSHGVFPLLVHIASIVVAAGCYAYAFNSLVSYSWKESSVVLVLARSWPGTLIVNWVIALLILNYFTTNQNMYESSESLRLIEWLHKGPLHLKDTPLFAAQVIVKMATMAIQTAVAILVLVLFLGPPFELPFAVQEVGLTIGTVYWLYENTNVYWNDKMTVVERCTGCVVASLAIRDWYYYPEALTTGEAFLIYTQLYLVMELWRESWYRVYTVADLKPDLHLMLLLQLPSFIMGGRSSLVGFLANGLQELVQFAFEPNAQAVAVTTELYVTWLDFVVVKCGGLYAAGHVSFLVYMWMLGDFEPSQLLGPQFSLNMSPKHEAGSSKSRRRKRRHGKSTGGSNSSMDIQVSSSVFTQYFSHWFSTSTEADQRASFIADMDLPAPKSNKRGQQQQTTTPVLTTAEKKQIAAQMQRARARARTQSSASRRTSGDSGRKDSNAESHPGDSASMNGRSRSSTRDSELSNKDENTHQSGGNENGEDHPGSSRPGDSWTWIAEKERSRLEEEQRRKLVANENERRKRRERQQRKKERRQERLRKNDDALTAASTTSSVDDSGSKEENTKEEDEISMTSTTKNPSPAPKEHKETTRPLCVQFLTNNCLYGANCRKRHPNPEEVVVLKQRYARIHCRWGRGCTRKNCLFMHPSKPEPRTSLATLAVQKVGEAWTAAVRGTSSETTKVADDTTPAKPVQKDSQRAREGHSTKNNGRGAFVAASSIAHQVGSSDKEKMRGNGGTGNESNQPVLGSNVFAPRFEFQQQPNTPDVLGATAQQHVEEIAKQVPHSRFVEDIHHRENGSSRRNVSATPFPNDRSFTMNRPPGFESSNNSEELHNRGVAKDQSSWSNSSNQSFRMPLSGSSSLFSFGRTSVAPAMELPGSTNSAGAQRGVAYDVSAGQNGNLFSSQSVRSGFKSPKLVRKQSGRSSQSTYPWEDGTLDTPINFDDLLDDPTDASSFVCDNCHKSSVNAVFSPCGHISYCTSCSRGLGSSFRAVCWACNAQFSSSDLWKL